jgi:hypothetical protein
VDYEQSLFELTESRFSPSEPLTDRAHRAVRRVRIWDKAEDDTEKEFAPNLYHVVRQLNDCESFGPKRSKPYREFHEEMKASNRRLQMVRGGCSLVALIKQSPRSYERIEPRRRFAALGEILQRAPAIQSVPPVRRIQFIQPVSAQTPDRVDLVSKISIAEPQSIQLKRIIQVSDKQHLQRHNELIDYLNHKNERRLDSCARFYEDMTKHGLKRAQLNARKEGQVSRLRVLGRTDWWEEFIQFAFAEHVGQEEEKLIARIARQPNLSLKEYYEYSKELENHGEERCLVLLKWLNAKCNWADEKIVEVLRFGEKWQRRSVGRVSRVITRI